MTKKKNNELVKVVFSDRRMDIELADNGIIIRNPNNRDEVTLALSTECYDGKTDYDEIYKAIGKKVYKWIVNEIIPSADDSNCLTEYIEVNVGFSAYVRRRGM